MYFIEFFNLPNLYKNFFTPWKAERERLKTLWKLRKSSKTKTAKCSSQKHVSKPNVQVSLALETVKGPKSPTKTSVKVSNVKCFPQSICSSETHLASQKWSFSRKNITSNLYRDARSNLITNQVCTAKTLVQTKLYITSNRCQSLKVYNLQNT